LQVINLLLFRKKTWIMRSKGDLSDEKKKNYPSNMLVVMMVVKNNMLLL